MIMRAKSGKTSSAKTDRAVKKKGGGFVYTKRDPKKIHERANQSGGQFDGILRSGIDTWRPAQGDNSIRILPPTWDGHDHYGFDVWAHQRVGVDNGSYPCLAKMQKKRCPICEAAKESADAGEEEEAKALQPTRKILVWMIDRNDDDMNPQIWIMSWTMDRDIVALCESKKTGKVLYIDHPDLGYDVSLKRKGQALNTRYFGTSIDRDTSPISDDGKQQDEVLEFIGENPIPSLIKYYDAKYLEQIMTGKADEKDEELDEDDEDEKPKKKKTKPADEEDEDEEEAPFDEEEEEAPKKKKRKPEPEEDEDDEEEEPAPKKKRKPEPEDEDEEEEPAPKKKKKPEPEEEDEDEEEPEPVKKKKRKPDPDEDEEEETVDDADEEEEVEERPKKKRKPEPEDEDEEEDEEEEERPRGKVKRRR